MATIKKISGVGDVGTLTTSHRLLVEAPNGTLGSTTVGAVNNHTHSYAGSSKAGGSATTLNLSNGTADASRFVVFQDSNNSTSTLTACYDVDFKYNPVSNLMNVGSVQLNSKVTLQYNSSTESLDFVFA